MISFHENTQVFRRSVISGPARSAAPCRGAFTFPGIALCAMACLSQKTMISSAPWNGPMVSRTFHPTFTVLPAPPLPLTTSAALSSACAATAGTSLMTPISGTSASTAPPACRRCFGTLTTVSGDFRPFSSSDGRTESASPYGARKTPSSSPPSRMPSLPSCLFHLSALTWPATAVKLPCRTP
ncbi:Uncharacterised protein [Escherichia coli]|nr:Uncharacterised protein [Escherichia coli]SQL83432.1 Uncharacterised protein [Escherichia coli]SQS25819.1 Uncharacterised protein [Escherichia coli]